MTTMIIPFYQNPVESVSWDFQTITFSEDLLLLGYVALFRQKLVLELFSQTQENASAVIWDLPQLGARDTIGHN